MTGGESRSPRVRALSSVLRRSKVWSTLADFGSRAISARIQDASALATNGDGGDRRRPGPPRPSHLGWTAGGRWSPEEGGQGPHVRSSSLAAEPQEATPDARDAARARWPTEFSQPARPDDVARDPGRRARARAAITPRRRSVTQSGAASGRRAPRRCHVYFLAVGWSSRNTSTTSSDGMNTSLNAARAVACGSSVRRRGTASSFVRDTLQSPSSSSSRPRAFSDAHSSASRSMNRRVHSCRSPSIPPRSWSPYGLLVPFTAYTFTIASTYVARAPGVVSTYVRRFSTFHESTCNVTASRAPPSPPRRPRSDSSQPPHAAPSRDPCPRSARHPPPRLQRSPS